MQMVEERVVLVTSSQAAARSGFDVAGLLEHFEMAEHFEV